MNTINLIRALLSVSLLIVSQFSYAQNAAPTSTIDGLQLIDDTRLTIVYAEPGINLSQYKRIYLDDAYIAFKKNWQRNQNKSQPHKVSSDDMLKIESELSALFRDIFSETLQNGGYELVTERAEDVLLIRPYIINLNVIAPDTESPTDSLTYSESAGEMTLYMELYDSLSDDLIAKALDRQTDRRTGFFQWQSEVTNRAAATRILQVWANVLKEGLDDTRGTN